MTHAAFRIDDIELLPKGRVALRGHVVGGVVAEGQTFTRFECTSDVERSRDVKFVVDEVWFYGKQLSKQEAGQNARLVGHGHGIWLSKRHGDVVMKTATISRDEYNANPFLFFGGHAPDDLPWDDVEADLANDTEVRRELFEHLARMLANSLEFEGLGDGVLDVIHKIPEAWAPLYVALAERNGLYVFKKDFIAWCGKFFDERLSDDELWENEKDTQDDMEDLEGLFERNGADVVMNTVHSLLTDDVANCQRMKAMNLAVDASLPPWEQSDVTVSFSVKQTVYPTAPAELQTLQNALGARLPKAFREVHERYGRIQVPTAKGALTVFPLTWVLEAARDNFGIAPSEMERVLVGDADEFGFLRKNGQLTMDVYRFDHCWVSAEESATWVAENFILFLVEQWESGMAG